MEKDTLGAVVEALIFMSDRPLPLKKIQSLMEEEVELEQLQDAVSTLQEKYHSPRHGIALMEVAGGFQFRTKQDYVGYIKKLCKVSALLLSPTAMEVLAVIAYRGPVSKSDIDKVRGVDSAYIIRGLMEKGLVRVSGKSEQPGRSSLYRTTQKFLEMFNLANLSDLPPEHELEEMAKEGVGEISDIRTLSHSGESFHSDELEELDRLGDEIKKLSADTDFTKALRSERHSMEDGSFKSAFEILAEHIGKKDVANMNTLAAQSGRIDLGKLREQEAPKGVDEEALPSSEDLEKGEAHLELMTGKMVDDAKKLDLDLDFASKEEG